MADAESRKPSAKDVADFKDAERLSRMQSKAKALETVRAAITTPLRKTGLHGCSEGAALATLPV